MPRDYGIFLQNLDFYVYIFSGSCEKFGTCNRPMVSVLFTSGITSTEVLSNKPLEYGSLDMMNWWGWWIWYSCLSFLNLPSDWCHVGFLCLSLLLNRKTVVSHTFLSNFCASLVLPDLCTVLFSLGTVSILTQLRMILQPELVLADVSQDYARKNGELKHALSELPNHADCSLFYLSYAEFRFVVPCLCKYLVSIILNPWTYCESQAHSTCLWCPLAHSEWVLVVVQFSP